MKKFIGILAAFAVVFFVIHFKPSLHFSDEYRGLYEMPISEIIYLQGEPLKNFSAINESDYHEFSMNQFRSEQTLLDKWLYFHDSVHDSGGITHFISDHVMQKWNGQIPFFPKMG